MNNKFTELNNKLLDWFYEYQIWFPVVLLSIIAYIMAYFFFSYINKNKAEEFYLNWSLEEHRYMDPVSKAKYIKKEKKKHYGIICVLIPLLSFYMIVLMNGYFIVAVISFLFLFLVIYILFIGSFKWHDWKSKKK